MELHFQRQHNHLSPIQSTKFKQRTKAAAATGSAAVCGGGGGNKFLGVRQRPSGRWVAEIKNTTQKIRMWLGTFDTAEAAARAYDEAARLLRGANTRTNFTTRRLPAGSHDSPLASRIQKLLHRRNLSGHQNVDFLPPAAADIFAASPTTSTESEGAGKQCFPASDHDDEVYRPDFSIDFELGSSAPEASLWAFDDMFDGLEMCKTVGFPELSGGAGVASAEVAELERLKVERQISASLYAMNGVQEYLEAVQDLPLSPAVAAAIDPVWDLPPLYHFYRSF